jgi:hypothetical protein
VLTALSAGLDHLHLVFAILHVHAGENEGMFAEIECKV